MAKTAGQSAEPSIERVEVAAFTIPTEAPESDGTLAWDSTTLILAEAHAAGDTGIGYSYTGTAAARLIHDHLAAAVAGRPAMDVPGAWEAMRRAVRNLGRPGLASASIAAVDVALWDLKGRLLGLSLLSLFGAVRAAIPIYGSGGFTSYSPTRLREQLGGWSAAGIPRVKMKVGRDPAADLERVRVARGALAPGDELMIDANGAYSRQQALAFAAKVADLGVTWFEEPVSSDDLEGLRLLRDRAPAGMAVAAGEYGDSLFYFRRLLDAGAVDVLQADATRCAGITEFLRVGALCAARPLPLSAHTAPALHAAPCCALAPAVHVEYFYDHVRIERMLFDGAPEPRGGTIAPDRSSPGLGLCFKHADAERFRVPF
jgi:L-alanine-DL-glutamate epimerase-like enolase superfamily enzyme